jgi:hypothetical protein
MQTKTQAAKRRSDKGIDNLINAPNETSAWIFYAELGVGAQTTEL